MDPVFLGSPGSGSEKMDRIRNTGLNLQYGGYHRNKNPRATYRSETGFIYGL